MMHSVQKAVQDRVMTSFARTMGCNCEGPVNSIALNRDASQIVVAGRNVFKIYSIDEDRFEEKANLRVGKHIPLNYCAADIAWNHVDENILASGATNGSVVIWDLNRHARNKQEHVFQEHKRTVNRVCFHNTEHRLLLSGSQDGSMKLFDTRKREVSMQFTIGSTSVRDVQFCPANLGMYFTFASADEGGNIQFWDMRRPDKMEKQFTGHSGPVFTIDWHPEDKNWFGTAGRDKTIKVWDLSKDKAIYTIQCIASVARIRWRPQRRFHIASCALLVDCSINIWDIQRPYIPFATFEKHKDVSTSIAWKNNDPHTFLSGSKDCFIYQHVFRDAKRPVDATVPSGIDLSAEGDILHSNRVKPGKIDSGFKYSLTRKPPSHEQFINVKCYMQCFSTEEKCLSMDWFVQSAQRYQLTGRSFEDLCEHNAGVAGSLDRIQVAQSWLMLKEMYGTSQALSAMSLHPSHQARTTSVMSATSDRIDPEKGKQTTEGRGDSIPEPVENPADATSGCSDEEGSDKEEKHLTSIARGQTNPPADWDMFFNDEEPAPYDISAIGKTSEWVLPHEAFQPRHDIQDKSPMGQLANGPDSPMSGLDNDMYTSNHTITVSVTNHGPPEKETTNILSAEPQTDWMADWNSTALVVDMLRYFAKEGDVQTPVSMLIVLKDRIRPHVDEMSQENWFLSYIDLLGRFKLWTVANEVIKLSDLQGVSMLNQQSTIINVKCQQCNRPLSKAGWLCDNCKVIINTCSICHLAVKGLYSWCQGCSHGGHTGHMKEWFSYNRECPVGCGHHCEYT